MEIILIKALPNLATCDSLWDILRHWRTVKARDCSHLHICSWCPIKMTFAAKCGFWSESTLFTLRTWISVIKHNNKNKPDTPLLEMDQPKERSLRISVLTLKLPNTTIVVCYVTCLWFLKSFCKQCGPRSDCSSVCKKGLKSLQEYSADDINRRNFQMQVFLAF